MSYYKMDFYQEIAQGGYSNITKWAKIGYSPTVDTTESDLWSAAGTINFPSSAAAREIISSSANDTGTIIKGDATGNTVQSDAGGSTTTLLDADVDFTAATAVAAGDCVILDPHGTTPEWGYVTTVAAHTLTCAGGFSSGGTGATRYYAVVDQSAATGAHVAKFEYLDGSYAEKSEISVFNGTTAVATVNTDHFRINSFRVIATGSGYKAAGNLQYRNLADTPIYSYITAGFTRARNTAYTVPAGKSLYVVTWNASFGVSGTGKVEYCRMYTRANVEPATLFNTGSLFYPFTEVDLMNGTSQIEFVIPTRLPPKTDIKVSALASASGVGATVLRGYIVS